MSDPHRWKKIISSGSKIFLFFLRSVLKEILFLRSFFQTLLFSFYCKASGAKIILWSQTRPVPVNSNSALAPRLQAKIRFLVFFFNNNFKKVSFLHSFSAFTVYCSFKSIVNLNYAERPHKFSVVNKKKSFIDYNEEFYLLIPNISTVLYLKCRIKK